MSGAATTGKRWGARSIASLLIFILAAALTPVALVGHWGHRTVIDSERYIQTVGPLIEDPEVQAAISAAVTDAVIAQVDTTAQVDGLLTKLFPDAAFTDQLASPIAAGINSLIGQLVNRFVASDQFATAWVKLNEAAQKGIVLVLEGREGGVVQLKGDDIVLDISSALTTVQQYLVDNGIDAAANITIPQTDREIVLYNSPALAQIRLIYSLTSPILQWLPLLVFALFALSIALARRRPRTVGALGYVLVITSVLLVVGLDGGESVFNNQLSGTPFGPASQVFWDTLLAYLILGVQALLALGVIVVVASWFSGRTKSARYLRGHVTRGLGEISARMPQGLAGIGGFLRTYALYVRWVIFLVVGLILVSSDVMSRSTVLWAAALAAGLVTVAQLVSGVGAAADPEAGPNTILSEPAVVTIENE